MNVKLPNGRIIQNVPDGTTKQEIMDKAIANGLATQADFSGQQAAPQQGDAQQPEQPQTQQTQPSQRGTVRTSSIQEPTQQYQPGFMDKISDLLTGDDRMTQQLAGLKEIGSAPELNEFSKSAFKMSAGLMATGDIDRMEQIIKANIPSAKFDKDAKGNVIVNLPSGQYALNKPGISGGDVARFIGQGLTYALGDVLAGPIAGGAGGEAAIQAAQKYAGADVTPESAAEDIALSTALGGATKYVPEGIKSLATKAGRKAETAAKEAAGLNVDAAKAESDIAGAYKASTDSATRDAAASDIAKETVKQTRSGSMRKDLPELAGRARTDEEIAQSAKNLGLEDTLSPGQMSSSQTYRELEGALAAVSASRLSAIRKDAIIKTAQKADDFITEFGGKIDKAGLSEDIKNEMLNTIDDLGNQAEGLYSKVKDAIPAKAKVDTSNIVSTLEKEAADLGGVENLPKAEKKILKIAKNSPTYALIDQQRKQIGAALGKSKGAFRNATTGELNKLYGLLTTAQEGTAKQYGAGDLWDSAKSLVSQRKSLEDNSIKLLGKNQTAAILPKLGQSMKRLSTGDYKAFDETMKAIPEKHRQEAVLSAMNDVFTGSSRKEKQLDPGAFVDWYDQLRRQPTLQRRINAYLPQGAKERLHDIYNVAKGIRDAESERVRTGVIQGLLKDFDSSDGLVSKLFDMGKKAAMAEGVTSSIGLPGVGSASVIVNSLKRGPKEPITQAADKLMSSPEFLKLVKTYGSKSAQAKKLQNEAAKQLTKSAAYKKWYNALSNDSRNSIIRSGIKAYLFNDDSADQFKQLRENPFNRVKNNIGGYFYIVVE